jgi:cytochrome c oxidase subunit II
MLFNFPLAPPSASNFAQEYDFVFYLTLALTVFFTAIVGFGVVFFVLRYRRGTKADRSRPIYEDLRLELTWTIIPLILGLGMFFLGARLFVKMRTPPADAQDIFVVGKQWMWHVQHSNGVRENNTLHVPVGKPVKLTLISQDVLHAFYIPAFRTQIHVVPGRYTTLWFTATQAGEYHLFCGMYCGTQHSEMGGKVVAMEPRAYAEWIANGGNTVPPMTMAQAGKRVWDRVACGNCHGPADTVRAPSLVGIFGKKRNFTDGSSLVADETYVRESIIRPQNHITQGYGDNTMLPYQDTLSEEELLNLLAYIKTLGGTESAPESQSSTSVANNAGKNNPNSGLAVGAMQADSGRVDPTPTNKGTNPSVGAIAAENKGR